MIHLGPFYVTCCSNYGIVWDLNLFMHMVSHAELVFHHCPDGDNQSLIETCMH